MEQTLRITWYLKHALGYGLLYKSNTSLKIQTFYDFDWTTCVTTQRFVSGYFVFLGTSLVAWKSKKQTSVSQSSFEAEYRVLTSLTCELQWIQYLLQDLHFFLFLVPTTPFVTTILLFTLPRIPFFMREPNISKLIVTLFDKSLLIALSPS